MKYNHTWEEVENAGRLYNVELSIDYDVTPYRPAKINCDPDDGYPAEGGDVNINGIKVVSVEMVDVGILTYEDLMSEEDRRNTPKYPNTDYLQGGNMIEKVSALEAHYWSWRFEKQITEDFKIELAEHAAADDEAMRERNE